MLLRNRDFLFFWKFAVICPVMCDFVRIAREAMGLRTGFSEVLDLGGSGKNHRMRSITRDFEDNFGSSAMFGRKGRSAWTGKAGDWF